MIDERAGGPTVVEFESDFEADGSGPVGADPLTRRLALATPQTELLVGRDPITTRLLERADGGLDRWQVMLLRWRFRLGWPVVPDTSRVARLSDLTAADAVGAFGGPGRIEVGRACVRWGAPEPGLRAARELLQAPGACRLPWSWPVLPVSVGVADWSGRRCQLTVRIVPSHRVRWPRRWYETAHAFLIELDARLCRGEPLAPT